MNNSVFFAQSLLVDILVTLFVDSKSFVKEQAKLIFTQKKSDDDHIDTLSFDKILWINDFNFGRFSVMI